jgi:hypothetical protein
VIGELAFPWHLERRSARFRPGEPIRGHVEIGPHGREGPGEMRVALLYRAGSLDTEHEERLAEEELAPDPSDPTRLTFTLFAPHGPLSYDGRLVHVRWLLRVFFADEPATTLEIPFHLVAAGDEAEGAHGYRDSALRSHFDGTYAQGPVLPPPAPPPPIVLPPIPLTGHGCGVVLLVLGLTQLVICSRIGFPYVGLFFIGAGLLALLHAFRTRPPPRLPIAVTLEVQPERAFPGDEVTISLSLHAPQDEILQLVTLELLGQEIEKPAEGSAEAPVRHEIFAARELFELQRQPVVKGKPTVLRKVFRLPADAPPSFAVKNCELCWEAQAHIAPLGPSFEWHAARRVVVLPRPPELP